MVAASSNGRSASGGAGRLPAGLVPSACRPWHSLQPFARYRPSPRVTCPKISFHAIVATQPSLLTTSIVDPARPGAPRPGSTASSSAFSDTPLQVNVPRLPFFTPTYSTPVSVAFGIARNSARENVFDVAPIATRSSFVDLKSSESG